MKTIQLFIITILIITSYALNAQVAINTDGSSANPSAILEVKSTEKGFLPPRMRAVQRDAISSPVAGLVIWCSNCGNNGEMQVFNGTAWTTLTGGAVSPVIWDCGNNLTDPRDSKVYSTVLIGEQCWMAQNLNVGTRINGNVNQSSNSTIEKYCYADNASNCDIYGGIYSWNEAMQYVTTQGAQGICPTGWHLPTDAEWTALTTFLGGTSVAGGKLKSENYWSSPNTGATNSSGFTALPGGSAGTDGSFSLLGTDGYWWSSTQFDATNAWYTYLTYVFADHFRYNDNKELGFSVRCIKNN
jgi:uncharacterized protein (TIGR02145 family)